MSYKSYKIEKDYKDVYYFLKDNLFSENFITNLRKKSGYIKINGQNANTRSPLKKDDILEIESSPNQKTTIMHCILPLDIVYEDKYYILINKPANLSCMPNKSHYTFNLAGAICNYFKNENFVLRIINRLDKDTSGIIICAKDSISQKDIKDIDKTYYAICEGKIDKNLVVDKKIETLSENGVNVRKRIISDNGKDAKTFVSPILYNENYSLISLKLENGRTHQIRVHLSSIGHPLIGDDIYGQKSNLIDHTALICKEISFYHPYLNKTMHFEVDFPDDIKNLITSLNLTK